jgi:thiamine-phosphate pyrophosphorylase
VPVRLPRLYPILDAEVYARRGVDLRDAAVQMCAAGVTLVQYRDKVGSPQQILEQAEVIREAFAGSEATLILNDRADLCVLAGWDGVHVGQDDLSPEDAKAVVLRTMPTLATIEPSRRWGTQSRGGGLVGVSTHDDAQVMVAEASCADYVAVGPVFATGSKANAEPVIGLEGVRRARALTTKPIVAIGGITRENARSVIEAGADSVAVIGALLSVDESVEQVARDFLELLR